MKKVWPLVALGIGAFLLLALVTLPARVVLSYFHPPGVTLTGVSGSIWSGRAQAVRSGAMHIGSVEWKLALVPLFTGKLGADVKVTRTDGFIQASVAASPAGTVTLRDLDAQLPLGALPSNVAPGGWTGALRLKLAQLTLANGWPVAASGTVDVADLVGPANRPAALGSYKVVFPAEGAASGDSFSGALSDTGGPLAVNGTVQLSRNRSYLVNGMIATRPGAPSDMTRTLEILGPPDDQGRREFTLEGTM
jgi:general secretion pathway protein N